MNNLPICYIKKDTREVVYCRKKSLDEVDCKNCPITKIFRGEEERLLIYCAWER